MVNLFSPLKIGAIELKHRVVMAPLTRMRASKGENAAHDMNAEYYRQRATDGGLIIAEASQVMAEGQGYPTTPGIHSEAQVKGWRKVTSAVHAKGGKIVLQLWHVGRISHSSFQPGGRLPVAPSAIPAAGDHFAASWGMEPFQTPRALETAEIPGIINAYRQGARNALDAGFDGVELHGANGYLIEQFLHSRCNLRTDQYGGSIENRTRLLLEVTKALVEVAGADRVGVRLSPFGTVNGAGDDDPAPLYNYAIAELAKLGPAYLHVIETRLAEQSPEDHQAIAAAFGHFRTIWPRVYIAASGYEPETAASSVASGHADAVAFGSSFISNPDLVERIRHGAALNAWDRKTFYGGGEAGYTDYPALNA